MSSGPPPGFFTDAGSNQNYSLHSRILATIILCLVFVISILAILHIYIRCFLRHRTGARRTAIRPFRISMSITSPTIVPQVDSGLDPTTIAALPTFAYRSSDAKLECVVCLSTAEEGEMVKLLPNCKHLFHVSCIDMWLHSHSTCPVCRAAAEPVEVHAGAVAVPPPPPPLPPLEQELGQTQESVLGSKEVGASSSSRLGSSSRFSSSFRKMLVRGFSGRREHGEGVEDLEKQ